MGTFSGFRSKEGSPVQMRLSWRIVTVCVVLTQCCPVEGSPLAAHGSPLSSSEYSTFFAPLRPSNRAALVCKKRLKVGCDNDEIKTLDMLENHGLVPKAPICSDIPGFLRFLDFCEFAIQRCSTGNFYAKRIVCPSQRMRQEEEAEEADLWTQKGGKGARGLDSDYEVPVPVWELPRMDRPVQGEQGDLQDLFARLHDPRAAQFAERLQDAVERGDMEAVDRESQRLLWALEEAPSE
ncbi:acrosin-binding protein-like [Scyliorhinus canicula]|uniref:acrosin-binding protein-like n=1 Tax=Scyliorhinus canicula TaxID=7830 RepID=UPI0018F457C8|nr:acrosin-binding protein-like [Scyliorhinus canicula]